MSKTLPVITFLLGDRVWRYIGSPYNCTAETLFMIKREGGKGERQLLFLPAWPAFLIALSC